MPPFDMEEFRREQTAIGEALAATREYGLPIGNGLDEVWQKAKAMRDTEKGLELLRTMWEGAQPSLAIIQAAHPGALKFFVDIKDGIKRDISNGKWD